MYIILLDKHILLNIYILSEDTSTRLTHTDALLLGQLISKTRLSRPSRTDA